MSKRDEILSQISQTPSLPPVASESISMLRDPDASIGDIAKLIDSSGNSQEQVDFILLGAIFSQRYLVLAYLRGYFVVPLAADF